MYLSLSSQDADGSGIGVGIGVGNGSVTVGVNTPVPSPFILANISYFPHHTCFAISRLWKLELLNTLLSSVPGSILPLASSATSYTFPCTVTSPTASLPRTMSLKLP